MNNTENNEIMGWVSFGCISIVVCMLLAVLLVGDLLINKPKKEQTAQNTSIASVNAEKTVEKAKETTEETVGTSGAQYKEDKCEVVFNDEQSVIVDYLYSWSTVDREKNINNVETSYSYRNISTEMIRYANTEAIVKEAIQNALGRTVTKDSSFSEIEHNVTEEVNKVTSLIGVSVDSVKVQGMQFRSQTSINK